MNEQNQNIDAESITRNKTYGAVEHLQHLLKLGWSSDNQIIKKFLRENHLSSEDIKKANSFISEQSKECCIDRNTL